MLAITIPSAKLLKGPLAYVTSAINKGSPTEECLLLTAVEGGALLLTAVDTKTHELRLMVAEASVESEGSVLVPATLFNKFARTIQDADPIQLGVDDNKGQLVIKADSKMRVNLSGEPPEALRTLAVLPPVVTTVETGQFTEALGKAIQLAGKDEFVTFVGDGDFVKLYTNSGAGTMFSRTKVPCSGNEAPWSLAVSTTLLGRLPKNFTGKFELCVDPDRIDVFVIKAGLEHLIIRQVTNDQVSYLVDGLLDMEATGYYVIKSDQFCRDLNRAISIEDKTGVSLDYEGDDTLRVYCSATGVADIDKLYELSESEGTIRGMNVDPRALERGIKALECVDLVVEQVGIEVPSIVDGKPPVTDYALRLVDRDTPDFRAVLVTALQVQR